ncbi:ATP-binding protein [Pseudomonas frederiksbergensis]|uniref:histidine kinase n=1 Tax=Pseudomonas frederiksbergensis TaxID=104087 RepID=A0A0B1Z1Y6_9PSED|nr:ATP-binding protein [Pseudomonas frederiksbergensis]KHK63412.1 histidine kinase [Pseudomonas frederiksbergensis]
MKPEDQEAFEQLLANCSDEPIRFPGAIQPHGVLLMLSEPDFLIRQVSANAQELIGQPAQGLLGLPLDVLFGQEQAVNLLEAFRSDAERDNLPLDIVVNQQRFDALIHRHQGALIVELEQHLTDFRPEGVSGEANLGRMLQRLQSAKSLQALYEISVREIQAMTGYDRVLIYRFEEGGHGQVIAEASAPSMELYKGLFFPASDIPEQARELYRTNWLRIIPNADYTPVPLVPELRPDTQAPLDLSFSTLRSVSPIHRQYMKNMGVLSSMSISLMKGEQLWGLISCGNRQPLHVPHEMRMACQTIGQILSLQISAMEAIELAGQRDAKLEGLQALATVMAQSSENVFEGLSLAPQCLMNLTGANGVAIIEDNKLYRHGQCPEPEQIRELHKWIMETGQPVFSHHNLGGVFEPAKAYQDVASGVLAIHLPKPVENGVLWFRPEVKQTINWSGDPQKPLDLEQSETGLRLRPRTSFEIWKVEMDGISTQWSHGDLFAANDLRRSALETDLARQVRKERQAVQARDELVAVVSHDLRNPMTVISMLCGMMQNSFSSDGSHSSKRISSAIDTMQQAASRMNSLLEDLLDTSRIDAGRYTIHPKPMDVSQIFEDACSLLTPLASAKAIDISFHAEPNLKINADPERLFQVLSNLIGNAIKFTPQRGSVGISAMSVGDEIVFSVRDTGEGIAPEQLPHVFDRYWTTKEGNPNGTGLGLYISQGIVQAHGGKLQAESQPGKGSEFRFTVPKID